MRFDRARVQLYTYMQRVVWYNSSSLVPIRTPTTITAARSNNWWCCWRLVYCLLLCTFQYQQQQLLRFFKILVLCTYTWCVCTRGTANFCYLHFALHPSERGLHQPDMLRKKARRQHFQLRACCLLLLIAADCRCTRCQVYQISMLPVAYIQLIMFLALL